MPPAVTLAEELERLAHEVRARQRQVVGRAVGARRQQRGCEGEAPVCPAQRQLDHVRCVRVLAVDLAVRGRLDQRQAQPHVELQARQRGLLGCVDRVGGGRGHDAIGRTVDVAEHLGGRADGDAIARDPGRIARAQHEQPLAVATLVQRHHRRAREQRTLLEAVDVAVAGLAEHALLGRERTQRGARDHEAVARRLRGGDRREIAVGDDLGQRLR